MLTINCPHCNAAMTCDDSTVGQYVQCYSCSQKFIANKTPMPPTGGAQLPPSFGSKNISSGGDALKYVSLGISVIALIAVLALFAIDFFRSPYADKEISFSKNPEKTALCIFERAIHERATRSDQEGYFWQEHGGSAIRNAEVETLMDGEDDDYVVVLISTKADKYDICGYYYLKKNRDDYFVICDRSEFRRKVDKKWLEEVNEKIEKHSKRDESDEID